MSGTTGISPEELKRLLGPPKLGPYGKVRNEVTLKTWAEDGTLIGEFTHELAEGAQITMDRNVERIRGMNDRIVELIPGPTTLTICGVIVEKPQVTSEIPPEANPKFLYHDPNDPGWPRVLDNRDPVETFETLEKKYADGG